MEYCYIKSYCHTNLSHAVIFIEIQKGNIYGNITISCSNNSHHNNMISFIYVDTRAQSHCMRSPSSLAVYRETPETKIKFALEKNVVMWFGVGGTTI